VTLTIYFFPLNFILQWSENTRMGRVKEGGKGGGGGRVKKGRKKKGRPIYVP